MFKDALQIHFLQRIVSVVQYHDKALYSYHKTPDINIITNVNATKYSSMYKELSQPDADKFSDKLASYLLFLQRLEMIGMTNFVETISNQVKAFVLSHVIDKTICTITKTNANKTKYGTAVINDANSFSNKAASLDLHLDKTTDT